MLSFRGGINLKEYGQAALGGPDFGAAYTSLLVDTYGADEVWRLTDMSNTTIIASVNSDRNGVATGWDLLAPNALRGPVAREANLAPFSDGANDYGDILTSNGSTGLDDIFNPNIGSVLVWCKFLSAAETTDGIGYRMFTLLVDAANRIVIGKSAFDTWSIAHIAGGAARVFNVGALPSVGWHMLGLNWTGASTFAHLDNAQFDVAKGAPGVWVGALNVALIGAQAITPTIVFKGNLAYAAIRFGASWSTADFNAMYAAALA